MRRIPWAFLLFLPACGTHAVDLRHQAPATLAREPFGYEGATVDRVVDGDTVVVRITGRVEGPGAGAAEVGEEYRVRLIGIDTPESVDPRRPVECFGQEAAAATGALLEEQPVMLIKDVEEQDSFGRLLRYVYIGQEMANARLVVNGYANAYTYPPNVRHTDLFVQLQREARISERGLWSPTTCQASTRWDGEVRRSSHPYGGEISKPPDLQLERPIPLRDRRPLNMHAMRQLSLTARLMLVLVAALGVTAYLVLADLGMNAGLIHYGVNVGHVDIGRMTNGEAVDAVQVAGEEMASAPLIFTTDGLPLYSWMPAEVGWQPRASFLVERATRVGRRESLPASISERISSYFGGVRLRWERPKGWRVERAIDAVAADAALIGLEVDEDKMARMIRHALRSWPRRELYEIPLS